MNYILDISYDGCIYEGYQKQPHGRTVQDHLDSKLKKIFKQEVKTIASSRTDARVHAFTQLVMFEAPFDINPDNLVKALNCQLDDSVLVVSAKYNENKIHVRHDVVNKTYKYVITKEKSPFTRNYAFYFKHEFDISLMEEAAKHLIGEHNFTSFCSANGSASSHIRTINYIKFIEVNNDLEIHINGNGFLYNMVRIIVSTLLDFGINKKANMAQILSSQDRTKAGVTAPPQGLYLIEINI